MFSMVLPRGGYAVGTLLEPSCPFPRPRLTLSSISGDRSLAAKMSFQGGIFEHQSYLQPATCLGRALWVPRHRVCWTRARYSARPRRAHTVHQLWPWPFMVACKIRFEARGGWTRCALTESQFSCSPKAFSCTYARVTHLPNARQCTTPYARAFFGSSLRSLFMRHMLSLFSSSPPPTRSKRTP